MEISVHFVKTLYHQNCIALVNKWENPICKTRKRLNFTYLKFGKNPRIFLNMRQIYHTNSNTKC
jgi:hypothetical protein